MSYNATKIVLRIPITALDGANASKALEYLSTRINTKPETDNYDGEVEWFDFPGSGYEVIHNNDKWYLDFDCTHAERSEQRRFALPLSKLQDIAETQISRLRLVGTIEPEDINMIVVQWYTGVSEPFVFSD